jgi:hypothetical protein
VKAAGGIACLSGIVARSSVTRPETSEIVDHGTAL